MQGQLIEAPGTGEVREYEMLIGGEWVGARSEGTFESTNPYTGRVWATAPEAGEEDVDRAVAAAREAFDEGPWDRMTGTQRARLIRRLADLLAENAEHLAEVESTDNGKLLREMSGQLKALPEWYYYFAGAADKVGARRSPRTNRTSLSTLAANPSGWWPPLLRGTHRCCC
jgi:(Z)-2-((N-methylformamido)methylene)-5-hydroxybutyrolactone dehydrogenase